MILRFDGPECQRRSRVGVSVYRRAALTTVACTPGARRVWAQVGLVQMRRSEASGVVTQVGLCRCADPRPAVSLHKWGLCASADACHHTSGACVREPMRATTQVGLVQTRRSEAIRVVTQVGLVQMRRSEASGVVTQVGLVRVSRCVPPHKCGLCRASHARRYTRVGCAAWAHAYRLPGRSSGLAALSRRASTIRVNGSRKSLNTSMLTRKPRKMNTTPSSSPR